MPKTMLTVATRKGPFVLESDETAGTGACAARTARLARLSRDLRRDHRRRSTPPPRASGTAPPSGAAPTSARRGSMSSEGLAYGDDDGRKISKVSTLGPRRRPRCSSASRRRASSRAATAARRGRSSRRSRASTAARHGTTPRTSRRAISGSRRSSPTRTTPTRFWTIVQGSRRLRDDRRRHAWTPRNKRPAPRLAAPSTRTSASASTGSSARRRPAADVPAEPRRHAPQRRRRPVVDGDHRGPAERVRLRGRRPSRTTRTRST